MPERRGLTFNLYKNIKRYLNDPQLQSDFKGHFQLNASQGE